MLIRMGRVLGRFQRERGMALSRPVAANSPLQSYFIDPDFAAVAISDLMFWGGSSGRGQQPAASDRVQREVPDPVARAAPDRCALLGDWQSQSCIGG